MKNWRQLDEIDWKREYEDLRRQALQTSSRGHGLALFLSRGNDGLAGSPDRAGVTTDRAERIA